MGQKINLYRFKTWVRRFREANSLEITNFAMDYAYSEYMHGRRTPLQDRMELFFGKTLDSMQQDPISGIVVTRATITPKQDFREVDDLVLPLKKNKDTKTKTNALAFALGKKYFIGVCPNHQETLYYVKSSMFTCCCCRYVDHHKEIKDAVKRLTGSRQAA